MDLRTGRVITRRNLTEIPVTDLVIQAVENLALQQGITTLKFSNDIRQNIYPADWIAGVDYDDTEYNDEDYNQPDLEELDDDLNEQNYNRIDQVELEDLI
jgi:hypothetical protein